MTTRSLLFLGKRGDDHCNRALQSCHEKFDTVESYLGDWGDTFPVSLHEWYGDFIISYLSRWIVPEWLLDRARGYALNFHPAPPEYPGVGCINFALYDNANTYGVTCHHMAPAVDSGAIVAVRRFPIYPEDSVDSLLRRTYDHQYRLFDEIIAKVAAGVDLGVANDESWRRRAYTREEFEELFRVDISMDRDEVDRRIRAVCYLNWAPYIEHAGLRFVVDCNSAGV